MVDNVKDHLPTSVSQNRPCWARGTSGLSVYKVVSWAQAYGPFQDASGVDFK